MKRFKCFWVIIAAFWLMMSSSHAFGKAQITLKSVLNKIISSSSISKTAVVSVSIRDVSNGKIVYERGGNLLLHPASTLKAFSTPVILDTLGRDNEIKTGLYGFKDNVYLKLSGDPLLTSEDLFNLVKMAKDKGLKSVRGHIIIDDSAIDNIPWGTGWMWDDENNSLMPKFNAFNLDHNLIKVQVVPDNKKTRISLSPDYPVEIINNAIAGNKNELTVERRPWLNPDTTYIDGMVSSQQEKVITLGTPQKYFIYQLKQVLKENNINFDGRIFRGKVLSQSVLLSEVSHKLFDEISNINKSSDNMASETLFKLAGEKHTNSTGTTEGGLKALEHFYSKIGADTSNLVIVDASGVSHNDLIQTNWMTLALSKLYKHPDFDIYLSTLAVPGQEGTLKNRLIGLSGKLWAKTGTHSGISGLTGYIKTKSDRMYCFAILIQNYKDDSSAAKKLEDEILTKLK